jgi:hypothetical protein
MSKAQPVRDPLLSSDLDQWRQRVTQLTVPMRTHWPVDAAEVIEANAGLVVDDILERPAAYRLKSLRRRTGNCYSISAGDLATIMRHLFHAGFLEAILMHRRELIAAGEMAEFAQKRDSGGGIGRAKSSAKKNMLAERIRDKRDELERAGEQWNYDVIAKAVGCSRSTVDRAINNRPAKRKKR